jgi:transmembrane sensor
MLSGLAIAMAAGAGLLLADRLQPLGALVADFSTGTGERRGFALEDGSQLTLNARTRVDVDFSVSARRLRLHEGDVVVQVAPDAGRPFTVSTAQADIRALGTRFSVRQEAGATRVAVQEHSVEVLDPFGRKAILKAGEGALIDISGIGRVAEDQVDGAEWARGLLVVNRRPLVHVVAEMQRYRRDVLRVSPEAENIPVQGVFPLDDIDRALAGLAETLPVTVTHYGPWLTHIDAR